MAGHGRTRAAGWGVWALLAILAAVGPLAASPPERLRVETAKPLGGDPMASDLMRADARLADVAFVDLEHGWAVGDRGTIWHTEDGGQTWQLQPSGVNCRLESVCFLDRDTGWAAGGYTNPYTHTSTGVVLITHDGGRQWKHAAGSLLPALKQIRFADERKGWAIGHSSAMAPSGVFFTDNGGRSWNPLPSRKTAGWIAGDFLASRDGVLADSRGATATVRRGQVEPAATPSFGLRAVARMQLVPEVEPRVYGWLVGQGGLLMRTDDLGVNWQTPPGDLPRGVAEQFDFAALCVRGAHVWVAGSPGTRVFHSADAGQSWAAFSTGQRLPIRSLTFVDAQRGWAVGELGTILATDDGGRTWRRVRSGGTRAALLGLFSEPDEVPLELFAQLSGNEGYLGVVETLARRDVEVAPRADLPAADRLHEAMVGVGASGARAAWRFPMHQAGLRLAAERIVDGWDGANDGRGLDRLKAHVVRQIRTWRPEVIVTDGASPTGDDPLGKLVHEVVVEAARAASDPTALSEQITRAGLEPWEVKKVYASLDPGLDGTLSLTTAELAERLGRSLADVAALPKALLEDRYQISPHTLGFRMVLDNLERSPARNEFFSGIVLYPGGEARRELMEPSGEGMDLVRRIVQKRRNMRAILERTDADPQQGLGLLSQASDLTRGLDPDGAARVLHHLAQRYHTTGQWAMAAEAFKLLVERHPDHRLADAALVWLVQYYAGSEPAWRVRGGGRLAVEQGGTGAGDSPFAVRQASAPAIDFSRQEDRPELAAAFAKQIAQTRPALAAEPRVGFPLAVADRRRGYPADADRFYLVRSRSTTRDAWWACARGEQWLAEPKGAPPKSVLPCRRAAAKPYLDGRLDDALWEQAKSAELHSPLGDDADWPAKVMVAYDAEFLYLAIDAHEAPGVDYRKDGRPRPRDPDLSNQDRVELFIDLDRDFTTYYRLAVDHRGWPAESCWGDSTWNPEWFVAGGAADGRWTAEAAVPLAQLTGRHVRSGHAWALGVQRVVPGVGFQSWSTPAAVAVVPEGFGYLMFE